MTSFVKVEFPKCSICLNGFSSEEGAIAHRGGEPHPFHIPCLENLFHNAATQPILCPVCRLELSPEFTSNPLQNPAPSVQAAQRQVTSSTPMLAAFEGERSSHWFDRLSPDEQVREVMKSYEKGDIDDSFYRDCISALLNS